MDARPLLPAEHNSEVMYKYKKVRPEDFDVEVLLAAAREGRLYVDERRNEVSKEQVIIKVRAYVKRIKVFTTPQYRSLVDDLWEQILATDEYVTYLTPGSKARKCRDFDKYNVLRVIGVLREKGVYQPYSDYRFHAQLEQIGKDSSFRKYLSKGIENKHRALLVKIRTIIGKYEL